MEQSQVNEEPAHIKNNFEAGWNWHFSPGIGSPTYQQKKEWLAKQAMERRAKLMEQEREDRQK